MLTLSDCPATSINHWIHGSSVGFVLTGSPSRNRRVVLEYPTLSFWSRDLIWNVVEQKVDIRRPLEADKWKFSSCAFWSDHIVSNVL